MTTPSCKPSPRKLRRPCAIERRNHLVQQHCHLVKPIALHYLHCSREALEDLTQVGMLGLIRAAELFDARQGTPFSAFARPHIRGTILHHLRDCAPAVRLPRRQAELQEKLLRYERQCQQEGRPVNAECLQRQLGIDACQWGVLLRQRRLNRPASLSQLTLEQVETVSPQDGENTEDSAHPGGDIHALLAGLECHQRTVIQQVVLGGMSYRSLARSMAVSPITVQRWLHRGLEQLRQELDHRCGNEPGILTGRKCLRTSPQVGPARSAFPGCRSQH